MKYIWYCYRNAYKSFSGRMGIFMSVFAVSILFSSNIVTLHRFNDDTRLLLVVLMLVGSGGEIIAPTVRMKLFFATPLLFYLVYGIAVSLIDFSLYTATSIFLYLLIEICVGVWRRR